MTKPATVVWFKLDGKLCILALHDCGRILFKTQCMTFSFVNL